MIQIENSEPAEPSGRNLDGRFGAGNAYGRGNPTAKHAQKLRQLFVRAVSEDDIKAIVCKLVLMAREGDIQAANLLLTRALGKPSTSENTMPLDTVPITSYEQIHTLEDAREFSLRLTPNITDECLEIKARLCLNLAQTQRE